MSLDGNQTKRLRASRITNDRGGHMFAQDEKVYVNGELSLVDHTYTSTNGTLCVHLYNGTNVPASDVMTFNDYWKRQRDMLAQAGLLEDSQ